jgi:hypothetical protein
MITLFYNYFRPADPARAAEIDACFFANLANAAIDRIVVVVENPALMPAPESSRVACAVAGARPTYAEIFGPRARQGEGVFVLINSDCFLDNRDTPKLLSLKERAFAAILRRELRSANPFRIDWPRTWRSRRKHEGDLQDAWAFRAPLPPGLTLDFRMGVPGCDNRIAGEFHEAGYDVFNPWRDIRLYHLHRATSRAYSDTGRVAQPYFFPVSTPKGTLWPPDAT